MRKNLKTITTLIEKTKEDIGASVQSDNQTAIMKNIVEILENLAIEIKNIKGVMENVTMNAEEIDERLNLAEDVLCDILDCIVPNIEEDDEDDE